MATEQKPPTEHEKHLMVLQHIKKEKRFNKGTQQQSIAYKNNFYNNMDSIGLILNKFQQRDTYNNHYSTQEDGSFMGRRSSLGRSFLNSRHSRQRNATTLLLGNKENEEVVGDKRRDLVAMYRERQKQKVNEISMDLALQGARNEKQLYFGHSDQNNSSIKCYHNDEEMKWVKSLIQKKRALNEEGQEKSAVLGISRFEDPSKDVLTHQLFKKRQLNNQS